jgi:hypothetical protein
MKTYLLISPQPWGKMYLSKHNYAIELAEAGNKVYFLNPPVYKKISTGFNLKVREELPNLYLVDYFLSVPLHILRFKARPVYDFIIRNSLIRAINKLGPIDELWCFEPNIFSSFKEFNAKKKVLFIVDQHDNSTLKKLAANSDRIVTISSLILEYFQFSDKPKLLLNHGLNKTFTKLANDRLTNGNSYTAQTPVKVAYVGNLLQGNRMDHETIKLIVEQNRDVQFHIYGPYQAENNTLGSTISKELVPFIDFLKGSDNVFLHGVLQQSKLAADMQTMDAFLTCYNYLTDYNKSSNCHKIIEYLSTGKVSISNRIITYENTTGLLEMPAEYTNENLPALFKKVISNLEEYNSPDRQRHRIQFALENTYKKHIDTITKFVEDPAALA